MAVHEALVLVFCPRRDSGRWQTPTDSGLLLSWLALPLQSDLTFKLFGYGETTSQCFSIYSFFLPAFMIFFFSWFQ